MIQMGTILTSADNSGAKSLNCVKVLGGSKKMSAGIGDKIVVSVRDALPNSKVKSGEVYNAVIVRLKKEIRRKDGSYVRFSNNAAVLLNKQGSDLVGSRIFGSIPRELRSKGYMKIISLAPEVL